jgi:hypothetical protein
MDGAHADAPGVLVEVEDALGVMTQAGPPRSTRFVAWSTLVLSAASAVPQTSPTTRRNAGVTQSPRSLRVMTHLLRFDLLAPHPGTAGRRSRAVARGMCHNAPATSSHVYGLAGEQVMDDDSSMKRRLAAILTAGIPGARFLTPQGRNHLFLETEPAFSQFLEHTRAFPAY